MGEIQLWSLESTVREFFLQGEEICNNEAYPGFLDIPKQYPFYRAVHISCGLNHAAVVLKCTLKEILADRLKVKVKSENVLQIINKAKEQYNKY